MKTRYLVLILLLVVFTIVVLCFVAAAGGEDNNTQTSGNDLQEIEDGDIQYIDDDNQTVSNEEALKYDVNQEYTDPSFVITLKSLEFNKSTNEYTYKLNFRNINNDNRVIDYSLLSCVVNQQSVAVYNPGSITLEGKKNKDIEVKCSVSSEEDDIYLGYVSELHNGNKVTIKFTK